jgi:hypothetical protein
MHPPSKVIATAAKASSFIIVALLWVSQFALASA